MTFSASRTRLASLFSDHAVLQAERACPVWGWDSPGQALTLRLGGEEASTRAGADGRFELELPARAAGGPYTLEVEGSTRVSVEDVWFGEVWLASGQSNMEWRVAASHDAAREIAAAQLPLIRAFKVPPRPSATPELDCAGAWVPCSPESVGELSAVGYFFARELWRARGVPIGIIDATWGGTRIEAWASSEALAPLVPELEAQRAQLASELADLPALRARYERTLLDWQQSHMPVDAENAGFAQGWAAPEHPDADWLALDMPTFWQSHGMAFNGVVWFRRAVTLPSSWAGRELVLSLGALDDFDDSYFDGALVGRTPPGTLEAHRLLRRYAIPGERVRGGSHVLAVRVFDHFGGGGFAGPAGEMFIECPALGERIALHGPWRLRVEREIPLVPMSVFETLPPPPLALAQQNAPAALFCGMIAPLIPYALRGALWYQGESSVDQHRRYRALQVALIRDYRTRWRQGQFPFYYVQLANYAATAHWPRLREAQAQAASEPQTGMVVTFDIGNPNDIHPTNKQEVGRRLSLWARARVYGEPSLAHEGPTLAAVTIERSLARVRLANAAGLRTSDGHAPRGFTLAGADGRHVPASARIEGDEVLLSCADVPRPSAVRYAFVDTLAANLQNAAGLPAAPFRTDAD
jgi:sialate O-acetylesterase